MNYNTSYFSDDHRAFAETIRKFTAQEIIPFANEWDVATRTMQFCADAAVQTLGGMGYMRGTRLEHIYREVKVNMIGGGAEEIMKDLASRQLG